MQRELEQYADEYEILSLLGEGGQASVYLGQKLGEEYALKIYGFGASQQAAYQKEADILARLEHPNIIKMFDRRPSARFRLLQHDEQRRPLIVLEIAQGDELFNYLSKTGKFTPQLSRYYIKQLLSAIRYLDDVKITHRDLKPENILFDINFTLKVTDFGQSKETTGILNQSQLGTVGYRAPEIGRGRYNGLKVDLFSVGVILFIMYKGTPPFLSTSDNIYRLIQTRNFPRFWQLHERGMPQNFFPDPYKRLINSLLDADPERRPTLQQLATNEWLNGQIPGSPALIAEMSNRANQMGSRAFVRRKSNIQRMCNQSEYRSNISLQDESLTKQEIFAYYYYSLGIETDKLPKYDKKNVIYTVSNVNLVISWIHCFLFQQQKNNNVFLANSAQQLKFIRYSADFCKKDSEIKIKLDFQIDGEDETELVLVGKVHQSSKGAVGIAWKKVEGNHFWLSCVQARINESLSSLL